MTEDFHNRTRQSKAAQSTVVYSNYHRLPSGHAMTTCTESPFFNTGSHSVVVAGRDNIKPLELCWANHDGRIRTEAEFAVIQCTLARAIL